MTSSKEVKPKKDSRAEAILWDELQRNEFGVKFSHRENIEGFVMDFYCEEIALAIEVDDGEQKRSYKFDQLRDKLMRENGIRTLRFSDSDILDNLDRVLGIIRKKVMGVATR
jgi:crossover junction endodeoxyribonuclease RuvC